MKVFSFFLLLSVSNLHAVEFKKAKIKINHLKVTVELAETSKQRERGLMGRTSLKENNGMLFIFDKPRILTFWMKNTKMPLSIGFFDKDKKLLNTHEMTQPKSLMVKESHLKRYSSDNLAMYALEMNKGWFAGNKIRKNHKFEFIDDDK